jgi:ENTS family enterobactin (siderophore) exporter
VVVIAAGIVWGAAIALFGVVSSLPLALFFLALAGMGDLISEVLRNALLQRYTPDQLRGRVSSLYLAQVTTAPALGNVEAGGVARLVSPTFSVISGGLACVAGALVLGALIPALRRSSLTVTADDSELDTGLGRAVSGPERRNVNRPAVMLADEPAGSVDTATCEETS